MRNVIDVGNNSRTDINKKLIPSIVPRRDNLNGKVCQFIFLKKFCMENDFAYNSIATTAEYIWTILAYNFILALNTLPWHRTSQENDAFDKDNPETESNSKFSNNLSQDTLKSKR